MFLDFFSILGLNAQLSLNEGVQVICLLCREVKDRPLAINIKKCIADGQHKFSITDTQVLALATDSARKLTRSVDDLLSNLSKEQETAKEVLDMKAQEEVQDSRFDDDPTKEIEECEDNDLETLEEDIDDESFTTLDSAIRLHSVAHRLQLAITDFLWKIEDNSRLMRLAQKLAAKLRNSIVRSMITDAKLNQAVVDEKSCWNSTYLMIVRLLELKEFCEHKAPLLKGLNISATKWENLKEICDVLKPIAELSSRLQNEQLDVTQFVGFWKLAMFKIEQQGSNKAIELKKCVEAREKPILDNRLIQTAIYLDKRFSFTLKPEEVKNAKTFIEQMLKKRKILAGEIENEAEKLKVKSTEKNRNSDMNQFDAFLSKLAHNKSAVRSSQPATVEKSIKGLKIELIAYDLIHRLPADTQIMSWWKNYKQLPLLKEVALDVISAPVTEVSVQRLFSHLNFILNAHRTTEHAELLEDILFLRMNNNWEICCEKFIRSDELQRHQCNYFVIRFY